MAYKYIVNHIPKIVNGEKNPKRPALNIIWWDFITIHTVGNLNSTALSERAWLTNPNNKTVIAYHNVIDEFNNVEVIPPWENAWHAGDGYHGTGNRKSLGVEIIEKGNFEKNVANTVYFVAGLIVDKMSRTGMTLKVRDIVMQHNRWNGSDCPRFLRVGNKWNMFLDDIERTVEAMQKAKELVVIEDIEQAAAQAFIARYNEPIEYKDMTLRFKEILQNLFESNQFTREQRRDILRQRG